MASYIQILFKNISAEQSALLIAELSFAGFEGFEEITGSMKAFIPADAFDEEAVSGIAVKHNAVYEQSLIEETNWNAVWESGFKPVVIEDFTGIRADFHAPLQSVQYEIIITPKMSFGTGHHATTYLMIQQMREIDFSGKSVFDFGTGTGVLAILAEKLGAKNIKATDNDKWSIENAAENIETNQCKKISLQLSSAIPATPGFDIILANINKNIILQHLPALIKQLNEKGTLLLSGLLAEDEDDIRRALSGYPLQFKSLTDMDNWICLQFVR